MSDQDSDQRRDALLLRLLKMPPQSRTELAEAVRRAKEKKPTRTRGKPASGVSAKREAATLKAKERSASKGRAHKGKTRQ